MIRNSRKGKQMQIVDYMTANENRKIKVMQTVRQTEQAKLVRVLYAGMLYDTPPEIAFRFVEGVQYNEEGVTEIILPKPEEKTQAELIRQLLDVVGEDPELITLATRFCQASEYGQRQAQGHRLAELVNGIR